MQKGHKRAIDGELVGMGTFSFIYRKEDIVIKKLRPESSEDTIEHECRMLKLVRGHVNVVEMIDNDLDWYSMEYVDSNLEKIKFKGSPLSKSGQIKGYLVQILKGIDYCHKKGIIHRDLKPQNILVSNLCIVKIADFGMAAKVNSRNVKVRNVSQLYATSWYRAPELLMYFYDYNAAIDIWSVGCILAEMLFGGNALFVCDTQDEAIQLSKIWNIRGTPDLNTYTNLSERKRVQGTLSHRNPLSDFRKYLTKPMNKNPNADLFTPSAIDLLEVALQPNPVLRASAEQLLETKYLAVDRPTPFTNAQLCHARFSQ
jgi:serine/threonine protein kinase